MLPWLALCAALVGTGVLVASLAGTRVREAPVFGDPGGAGPATRDGRPARAEDAVARASTTPAQDETDAGTTAAAEPRPLITEGVTVQVLNGTKVRRADDRMVNRLVDLGFSVLAVHEAATRYGRTTVFWSRPADRPAAEALAVRFGWRVGRKPRNLSASVTTHVVVGRDQT